jgi:hypothetical protein
MTGRTFRTRSGKNLTDEDIEAIEAIEDIEDIEAIEAIAADVATTNRRSEPIGRS